ncbi:MAG: polysaccharide deacetylase family protein, partial [Ferruginibacter sp.]
YKLFLTIPISERLEMLAEKEIRFSIATNERMMNWNEILECCRNKVEIGCHTYNHDTLSTITDETVLQYEIATSKKEIEEKINTKINILALPNGQGNPGIYEIAKNAGIDHVLYVGDKINALSKYTDGEAIHDSYRINLVQETMPQMILRTELFHAKLRKYV